MTILSLLKKHKSTILYLVFGGLTTLINISMYSLCIYALSISNLMSNIISWIISVLFAYITNKLWVFESKSFAPKTFLREISSFFLARIATGVFDLIFMFITVDILSLHELLFKIISNVVVIILNYIASKLIVFRKTQKETQKEGIK